ncbi:unnamed protein product [Agarophyton chilense]|eukprot:gb/GEZJ01003182.1/.p1 GENE.gb/GEZJ01003182.1/~~gb/GEZJ01003182.1/.p1  ORF type:complete len:433 (-),score=52.30 gb/GEZJ01003182.1/:424-1722(-)
MPLVGLDITRYKPARQLSHYGTLGVTDTGSVRALKLLSDEVVQYLEDSGVNSSLWNGSKGEFGREYDSNKAHFSPPRDRQSLFQRYMDLRKDLPSQKALEQLNNNLEIQMRTQRQIITSVYEIEKELEELRKIRQQCTREENRNSVKLVDLAQKITRLESDCAVSKATADKIKNKVNQTRNQISESETGYLRRIALLRCLVHSMGKDERPNNRSKADMNEDKRLAREADGVSGRTCTDYLQVKRVYIDAKTGVLHLYNLERVLKGVLEHLEVCVRNSSAPLVESNSQLASTRTIYIRRQWALAKSNFDTALPFLKNTSLISARGMVEEQLQSHEAIPSNPRIRDTGVFNKHPLLLPSYARMKIRHLFSRKSFLIQLHRTTAKAYKEINLLYDCHERTVKEALEALQEKEVENRRAHDELIKRWESLLGIQSD